MSVLELKNVSKVRGAGRHAVKALDGVSLRLEAKEFVLLQGPSGSGKTTLLAVAAGLLTADSGEVVVEGCPLRAENRTGLRWMRASRFGFVFQRSNLLSNLSARENVLMQAALAGVSQAEGERQADELLEALRLGPLAARRPAELSGGEEQRVAVARALVHRPAVVLADEPTANLDSASGQAVAEQLLWLARARGAAVLAATHDLRLEAYATRRLRIIDGRIHEDGG